jgi:predicted nucleic acid-binding protein
VAERLVVDASAMVDLLVGSNLAAPVEGRLRGHQLHAPAHLDAEVLSALGRLQRSGRMPVAAVTARLEALAASPIERHLLAPLLAGAWERRHYLRLVDALYVELAERLDATLVTTAAGLAGGAPGAHLVTGDG